MTEVYKFLKSLYINEKEPLVIAVSYGPDSMFLLDLLKKMYNANKIICAHVHHNHRKESDEEARLLKEYCDKNNIIFEFMKIDSYTNGRFTEEEARKKRYEFFDKIMTKYNSKYLFTAHHGDDLVETILMKITRGSSFKGYSGINLMSSRKNYKIIRPLLYLTKDDINVYCEENNVPYAIDSSNLDDEYKRNRYRKYILPRLKEENKDVHLKFLNFSQKIQSYEKYVNDVVNKYYNKVVVNDVVIINKLLGLDDLIIEKIIERYLFNFYGDNIYKITDVHRNTIIKMLKENKSNKEIVLPNKIKLVKSYNKLYFDKENNYNSYCYSFTDKLKLPNGYVIEKIDELENTSNYVSAFNSKEIALPIRVRTKENGDKIEILGLDGNKKIKDVFIDEKIDVKNRQSYPVVVDKNDRILWLPGLKKSKYDKSKTGKYDIILKYYKEEHNDTK